MIIPVGIYLLKVNNRNTRTRCEICSKLTINTTERRHWRVTLHSAMPELKFCASSNPIRGVSEIRDGEALCQWSRLDIRLKNAFRRSTIPQKQYIIIIETSQLIFQCKINWLVSIWWGTLVVNGFKRFAEKSFKYTDWKLFEITSRKAKFYITDHISEILRSVILLLSIFFVYESLWVISFGELVWSIYLSIRKRKKKTFEIQDNKDFFINRFFQMTDQIQKVTGVFSKKAASKNALNLTGKNLR